MQKPGMNSPMLQQYNSSNNRQSNGSLSNMAIYQTPGAISRYGNPTPPQSPSKVPVLPHQDYLKYAQGTNIQYNPYNPSNISPTLMARPTIEPWPNTQLPASITNAIARGRDPTLYSSVCCHITNLLVVQQQTNFFYPTEGTTHNE